MPDQVAEACKELAARMQTLESLVGEPVAKGPSPGFRSRAASAPEVYGEAGRVLMTSHEGIRRALAWCQYVVAGHPGPKMGGSDAVTARVFRQLPRSAAGLPGDYEIGLVIRYLDRLIRDAKAVHGIGELPKVRHLRWDGQDEPGVLPPQCPGTCRSYFLVYDEDAGTVACTVYGCEDRDGRPPVAELGTDEHGRPALAWADGRIQVVPGLALAG